MNPPPFFLHFLNRPFFFFLLTFVGSPEHIFFSLCNEGCITGSGRDEINVPLVNPDSVPRGRSPMIIYIYSFIYIYIYIYILGKNWEKFRFSFWSSYHASIHYACMHPNLSKLGPVKNVGNSRNSSTREKRPKRESQH